MIIGKETQGSRVVVRVSGRLDADWGDFFRTTLQQMIRDGLHQVYVDASELEYISSVGIRALLKVRMELQALNGSFGIVHAAPFISETLRMSGLDLLLLNDDAPPDAAAPPPPSGSPAPSKALASGVRFECHELAQGARITVRAHAAWKPWQTVRAEDAVEVAFPAHCLGVGIGASGLSAQDAHTRFGEFVAAAGCVAWLAGDGADKPDYLEGTERYVPRLYAIQALVGEGDFSHLLRFHPDTEDAFVNLSDLFDQALLATQTDAAVMVALAEVEGLVGVALSQSPCFIGDDDQPGAFPDIRGWLQFCGDRVHRRDMAMLVAFVSRDARHAIAQYLVPTPSRPEILAHVHALAMPYRSLPQGVLDLEHSVRSVFEDTTPLNLMHLVEDDRPVVGLGQSAFIRGACWCAPLEFKGEPTSWRL